MEPGRVRTAAVSLVDELAFVDLLAAALFLAWAVGVAIRAHDRRTWDAGRTAGVAQERLRRERVEREA